MTLLFLYNNVSLHPITFQGFTNYVPLDTVSFYVASYGNLAAIHVTGEVSSYHNFAAAIASAGEISAYRNIATTVTAT